eukprot:7532189-Pyramimonas_sp.AAC.1
MYAGAADARGMSGCQIWIARSLDWHLHLVRHVGPRISLAIGKSGKLNTGIIVIAARAPTEASAASVKDPFWDELDRATLEAKCNFPAYICVSGVDANSRVAPDDRHVGPCEPGV